MAAKRSKRLVIDASVARSAGNQAAKDPVSIQSRDFLAAVRTICHQIVMTTEIGEEWQRHQSSFSRRWLVSMRQKRKVCRLEDVSNKTLREKMKKFVSSEKAGRAIQKDLLLIEAALMSDRIIASLDEAVRGLFASAAQRAGELRTIVWVNPGISVEESLRWLENGARPEKFRLLGFGPVTNAKR